MYLSEMRLTHGSVLSAISFCNNKTIIIMTFCERIPFLEMLILVFEPSHNIAARHLFWEELNSSWINKVSKKILTFIQKDRDIFGFTTRFKAVREGY